MTKFLETIKAVDGKIYNLYYHQKRYEKVLDYFHIKNKQNLQDYLSPPQNGIYRCRLEYDEKNLKVEYIKYEKRDINSLKLIYDDFIEYNFKYKDRENLNNLYKQRENCSDILIVKNSLLTDTSIANISLFDGKNWLTPKKPLLEGTTRQRLLDEGKIRKKNIHIDDLFKYKKIALLNSMIDFDIINSDNLKDIIC
ncbi:MAG: branched-chain amino acid aminotransferase [Sulfurimonas sp.]|nr:MAG: branched-chain amino acid aminotransferase [Sulfurimonas sp.]